MEKNNIKVFTVEKFDKNEIERYITTVSYHVVIGMNFFADFMQSFTDVFGGKSESYQRRLKEINEEVLSGIKEEVRKVGGNCAIDLKIDNDEISAKGKSMIMVTAIATAVTLNLIEEDGFENLNEEIIYTKDFKKYLAGIRFKKLVTNGTIIFSDEINKLITNKATHISEFVFVHLVEFIKVKGCKNLRTEKIFEFFAMCPNIEIEGYIIKVLELNETEAPNSDELYEFILSLIHVNNYSLKLSVLAKLFAQENNSPSLDIILLYLFYKGQVSFVKKDLEFVRKFADNFQNKSSEIKENNIFRYIQNKHQMMDVSKSDFINNINTKIVVLTEVFQN